MNPNKLILLALLAAATSTLAHEWHWPATHPAENTLENSKLIPPTAKAFASFKDELGLSWDEDHLHVECNGLPSHPMMSGITAWQQQVPLPHNYTGKQAYKIPLKPTYAEKPGELTLIGPIALAINGIPIFHALTQSGKDAYAGGELDRWGGHCGRADDYHYHIAPAHLQEKAGKGNPVAFALDGYPIHIADPSIDKPLDECHGYMDDQGQYRYVGNLQPPYVMSFFRGAADLGARPRAQPMRPHLPPLRGAKITDYTGSPASGATLTYTLGEGSNTIEYSVDKSAMELQLRFTDSKGKTTTQTHQRQERQERGQGPGNARPQQNRGGKARPPQNRGGENRPRRPQQGDRPQQEGRPNKNEAQAAKSLFGPDALKRPNASFVLASSAVKNGGELPNEFTGDGGGATLPLSWKGAPKETKSYALVMDHLAPGDEMKSYWTMWDIPSTVTSLAKNTKGIGKVGAGFRGQLGYEPPRSRGAGEKIYVFTVYALSSPATITGPALKVDRDVLLAAMKDKVLASSSLSVSYTRGDATQNKGQGEEGKRDEGQRPAPRAARPNQAQDGQRKPWMQMHGPELDGNRDGVITADEFADDVNRAIALYDPNKDRVVTAAEREAAGDVRKGAAFAGLTYRHFTELDVNADGKVSQQEYHDVTKKIFSIADQDSDGSVTKSEWETSPQAPLKKRPGDRPTPRAK